VKGEGVPRYVKPFILRPFDKLRTGSCSARTVLLFYWRNNQQSYHFPDMHRISGGHTRSVILRSLPSSLVLSMLSYVRGESPPVHPERTRSVLSKGVLSVIARKRIPRPQQSRLFFPDITEFAAGEHPRAYIPLTPQPNPFVLSLSLVSAYARAVAGKGVYFSFPTLQNLRIENRLLTRIKMF